MEALLRGLKARDPRCLRSAFRLVVANITWHIRMWRWKLWLRLSPPHGETVHVSPILSRPPVVAHKSTVDIIVCVHNALEDVQRCLGSVLRYARPTDSLLIVDDGSSEPTRDYLLHFAAEHDIKILRNEIAQGYTRAANRGLRESQAEYVVLLNSDTIVTEGWLDRLIACAESNERYGIVGPLSNTASWQSIPEIEDRGDWAENPLPAGVSVQEMGELVARYSGRLYVPVPLLNGFCLCIKRAVLDDVGLFDEENFGPGYGEEDDYVLRMRKQGWQPALADDVFVFHAQSRSYSDARRRELGARAGEVLSRKHGARVIEESVEFCQHDRVLEGIRARSRVMFTREESLQQGRERFGGRKLLFLLPVLGPSGGANVVMDEAIVLQRMGIEVEVFNLPGHRLRFEQAYPSFPLPVIYGDPRALPVLGSEYDAVVATVNTTVSWLSDMCDNEPGPRLGYYVQDFEPLFYAGSSRARELALRSYTFLPDVRLLTKTNWTRDMLRRYARTESTTIGPSVNVDLFRPRPRDVSEWPERPLRVAALVRAGTPHRAPDLTMRLLERACRHYSGMVEAWIFGIELDDPYLADIPHDFAWKLAGVLTQRQVARFLSQVDVFVDFSSHQAMGLTAMESMACGCAVIVPRNGGATDFARHMHNALVVDTASESACWEGLQRLIEDHQFRSRLQTQALRDICNYPPEYAALRMLEVIFEEA